VANILNEQQLILIKQLNSGELLPSPQELYKQIYDEVNKPQPACLYAQNKEEV
jgi:hypothetical protein